MCENYFFGTEDGLTRSVLTADGDAFTPKLLFADGDKLLAAPETFAIHEYSLSVVLHYFERPQQDAVKPSSHSAASSDDSGLRFTDPALSVTRAWLYGRVIVCDSDGVRDDFDESTELVAAQREGFVSRINGQSGCFELCFGGEPPPLRCVHDGMLVCPTGRLEVRGVGDNWSESLVVSTDPMRVRVFVTDRGTHPDGVLVLID